MNFNCKTVPEAKQVEDLSNSILSIERYYITEEIKACRHETSPPVHFELSRTPELAVFTPQRNISTQSFSDNDSMSTIADLSNHARPCFTPANSPATSIQNTYLDNRCDIDSIDGSEIREAITPPQETNSMPLPNPPLIHKYHQAQKAVSDSRGYNVPPEPKEIDRLASMSKEKSKKPGCGSGCAIL